MDPETDDREPIVSGVDPDTPAQNSAAEPAVKKPAARKPAARKSTAQKPAARKPTAQKPAATKSTAAKATAASAKTTAAKPSTRATSSRGGSSRGTSAKDSVATPTASASSPAKSAAAKAAAAKKSVAKKVPSKPAATTSSAKPAATTAADKPEVGKSGVTEQAAKGAADRGVRETVLKITGLSKHYGQTFAVDDVSLAVSSGTVFGIVGPNGAGKTTTLSMVTGLLRPDAGTVEVHGANVWTDPAKAKRNMGVLPDRLRLFDRLTGNQLLYYAGVLRGLSSATVKARSADLAVAFGLEEALDRLVADYSAGMTKKIAIAAAMIHSPRLLVLDEPFESVDPVSAANVIEILQKYTDAGGTVVLSSHSMDLIQRICDSVAIIVDGKVLDSGTMKQVRGTKSLEERFVELAGGRRSAEGMEWLHTFSD